MRGYQTQRQTISQLRQRDTSSRSSVSRYDDVNNDDVDDDDDAEFLQSNLRAHQYRKQQINALVLVLQYTVSFHCFLRVRVARSPSG